MIDTKEGRLEALIESEGLTPHPGRGANFVHPKYGPVWATSHLGDETISLVGTEPEGIPPCLEGGGDPRRPGRRVAVHQDPPELQPYLRRHPAQPGAEIAGSVAVFKIDDLDEEKRNEEYEVLPIGEWSGIAEGQRRVVQPEFNKQGTEVWFSVWNAQDQQSAIVIVDDKTLELKHVIKGTRSSRRPASSTSTTRATTSTETTRETGGVAPTSQLRSERW